MRTSSILLMAAVCSACTPYDPSLPATPFFCGDTDPKCPDGYTCIQPTGGGSAVCTTTTTPTGMCTMPHSGVLATWDFTGAAGGQASTAATASAPGVTATSITRAAALMATTGAGSISAAGWSTTSQLDAAKYYTLSIAPPTGCALSLSSMSVDVRSSSTGPSNAAVATSADAFTQTSTISTTASSVPTLSITDTTSSVELRIYGYGASATTGTMRVQTTLMLTGTIH